MAFKLQYKPHIMMTMRADTITRIRVDYTIHLSQSQFFESREGEAGQVQYDTNLNYNTQTADSLYDWACKPLSGSLIPNLTPKPAKSLAITLLLLLMDFYQSSN